MGDKRLNHMESFRVEVDGAESNAGDGESSAGQQQHDEASRAGLIPHDAESPRDGGEAPAAEGPNRFGEEHLTHGMERGMGDMQQCVEGDADDGRNCCQRNFTLRTWLKILAFAVYIGVVLVLVLVVRVQDRIAELEQFGRENQVLGGLLIIVVYATTVVFYIPGSVLTIVTAGLLFNFWLAVFLIWVSANIAQTIAFLAARYLLQESVLGMASRFRLWKALEDAVTEQGFVVTLLCRAPGMPYNTINYVMGVTEVKFWVYTAASAIGVVPKTVLYIFFGETLGDAIRIFSGAQEDVSTGDKIRLGVSLGLAVLCFVLVVVVMQWALRRKLREIRQREQADAEAPDPGEPQEGSSGDGEPSTPGTPALEDLKADSPAHAVPAVSLSQPHTHDTPAARAAVAV